MSRLVETVVWRLDMVTLMRWINPRTGEVNA